MHWINVEISHCWYNCENNQKPLLPPPFFLQQSLEKNEIGVSLPSVSHFFNLLFSLCVCQALGTTLISNRKVEQTKRAFSWINRDQSLHFEWVTKEKQQLKVCLLIVNGQLPKKYHRKGLVCCLVFICGPCHWLHCPTALGVCMF